MKKQTLTLLTAFLLVASFLPIIAITSEPVQGQPPENTTSNTFGNPDLPDWKDVLVDNSDPKWLVVNNSDGLVFRFATEKDKFNEIYQDNALIVKDERWLIWFDGKEGGSTTGLEWERVENYNVRVTQLYEDKKSGSNSSYKVTWDFYGGFRPKVTVELEAATAGNYKIDWRANLYKDYAENMTNYARFWDESDNDAVVFDYSDVYEALGDITKVENIEGWFKGKRFDLYFDVGNLGVENFVLDPNFGYEHIGGFYITWGGIYGSWFSLPEDGTVENITFYTAGEVFSRNVRCAIYKKSDNSFVAETGYLTVNTTPDWRTFSFSSPPSLEAGDYWLDGFGSGVIRFYCITETGKSGSQTGTYPNWPDPWSPTIANYKVSIYATYSTGRPVLISPENNYSTSDNTPTFVWENGADATSHRLVIDNSQNFDDGENIYDNASAWNNSGTAIENELPVDNYWWRVCAVNAQGENWSKNTWTFEVVAYVPPSIENVHITDADNIAAGNLAPQTEYRFWVEIQDNNTLADIENVTLVVYLDNENLADNEVNHYTFRWTRNAGFVGYSDEIGIVVNNNLGQWTDARLPSQHKAFHIENLYWIFYCDSAADDFVKRTSTDGISWTASEKIQDVQHGAYFDVGHDGENFHFAFQYPSGSGSLLYRKGTALENGDINWLAGWQVVASGSEVHGDPIIDIDSNGYPWIGYIADNYNPKVIKSDNKDGTWQTSSGFPYQLHIYVGGDRYIAIPVSLANGQVYVVYGFWENAVAQASEYIQGKLWDGDSWGDNERVSVSLPYRYYSMWSASGMGNDVHVGMFTTNQTIVYMKRTWGSGWGNEENIKTTDLANDHSSPTLLLDEDRDEIWVFWSNDDEVRYRKKVNGAWENEVVWIDETADGFPNGLGATMCSGHETYDNKVLTYYVTETSGSTPYQLKFAYIDLTNYDYLITENCVAGDNTKIQDNFIFAIEFGEDATVTTDDNWDVWVQVYDSVGNQDNRFFLNRFDIVSVANVNTPPLITSITCDNTLVDRKLDYPGSTASKATRIYIKAEDNGGRDGIVLENCRVWIRDNNDTIIIDNLACTDYENIDENTKRFWYDFEPSDALPDDNLGAFDVKAQIIDNYGAENTKDYTSLGFELFTVNDLSLPAPTVSPPTPYRHQQITVSGSVSRVHGTASLDNAWVLDQIEGTLVAEVVGNTYSATYEVTSNLGATVSVHARALDLGSGLDGISPSVSYTVVSSPTLWVLLSLGTYEEEKALDPSLQPGTYIGGEWVPRDWFYPGETCFLRAHVRDANTNDPVTNARVEMTLVYGNLEFEVRQPESGLYEGSLLLVDIPTDGHTIGVEIYALGYTNWHGEASFSLIEAPVPPVPPVVVPWWQQWWAWLGLGAVALVSVVLLRRGRRRVT